MKRLICTLIACGALAFAVGCSDDDKDDTQKDSGALLPDVGGGTDTGTTPDTGTTADTGTTGDTGTTQKDTGIITPKDHNIGVGCAQNTDCKKDSPLCLQLNALFTWAKGGVCTAKCTPDSSTTPLVDEDSCPKPGYRCASFRYSSGTINYCLKKCDPSLTKNPCDAKSGTTCHPRSTQWSGSLTQAVCLWPKCTTNKDCPVTLKKTCTTDSDCSGQGTGAFCYTSGQCALPGNCTTGGLCGKHTKGKTGAKVGDACKDDKDCPGNGACMREDSTGSGNIGVHNRNGYCTIGSCSFAKTLTDFACDSGSACNGLYYGGTCFKKCDLKKASDCRGNAKDKGGDFECYAWNNLSVGGTAITSSPLCQSAASITCDFLGTSLDCSSLGLQNNPTKMGCRDRYTGKAKATKYDTTGVCLDDTASGAFKAVSPDAGTTTPDAGTTTPDASTTTPDSSSTAVDAGVKE